MGIVVVVVMVVVTVGPEVLFLWFWVPAEQTP
jgi:hypothetical protein